MSSPLLSVVTAGVGSSANAAIAGAHRAAWHTADDDVRLQRYRRFLDFDNGKHDVGRLGFGQTPIVANYARVFVRKGASYLVPRTAAEVAHNVAIIAGTTENVTVVEEWSDATYRVLVDDLPVLDGANPYGFIPYLIFPNTPRPHEFWGVSDLADILEVNRALDRRLSILAQILELSGNPVTVLENVTGAQGVNVAPGALWELPENSRAYLLDLLAGGSVEQHLRYIEALYRIMDDLGEMPRMSFGEAGQARSGIALTVQLQPVVQKTNRKRLIWGAMVRRRAELALRLLIQHHALDLGPYTLDAFALRAIWAPILPVGSG